jgi:hypothetical protein
MTSKNTPTRLLRVLAGVLVAVLAFGCAYEPPPSARASQSAAMLRTLEVMMSPTPSPSVYKAPTAAPTPKATPKPTPRPTARPTTRPVPRPVARVSHSISGKATWYRWHLGEAAAGPLLRKALGPHWRGRTVTVCSGRCTRVRLTDWCLCSRERRLVDLDSRSFARLAPLSRGKIAVTVSW